MKNLTIYTLIIILYIVALTVAKEASINILLLGCLIFLFRIADILEKQNK